MTKTGFDFITEQQEVSYSPTIIQLDVSDALYVAIVGTTADDIQCNIAVLPYVDGQAIDNPLGTDIIMKDHEAVLHIPVHAFSSVAIKLETFDGNSGNVTLKYSKLQL